MMERSVEFNNVGLSLLDGSKTDAIDWLNIDRIFVFKKDLLTSDLICLMIDTKEGALNIDEEMEGYDNLVQSLPDYLPGCVPFSEWFPVVAFPAFEVNPTIIYERGKVGSE